MAKVVVQRGARGGGFFLRKAITQLGQHCALVFNFLKPLTSGTRPSGPDKKIDLLKGLPRIAYVCKLQIIDIYKNSTAGVRSNDQVFETREKRSNQSR